MDDKGPVTLYSLPFRVVVVLLWLVSVGAAVLGVREAVGDQGAPTAGHLAALAGGFVIATVYFFTLFRARVELSRHSLRVVRFVGASVRLKKQDITSVDVGPAAPWGHTIWIHTATTSTPAPAFQVRALGSDSMSHRAMGAAVWKIKQWLKEPE